MAISRKIDSISLKKKNHKKVTPKKVHYKFANFWWLLLLLPLFIFFSFWLLKNNENKLDLIKFFRSGRYLVLFQNNAELRPTGGFIGSFAVVDFQNYRIKNVNFNTNIYKLDNAFKSDHVIVPPKPLAAMDGNKWYLCDSNFDVSLPEASQDIEWFYNQETGDKVDGIITINASLVRDLIKIVGPIELPDTKTTITADNFFTQLTTIIENDYYQNSDNKIVNEPKSVLTEMFPSIIKKAISLPKWRLAQIIFNALKTKDIMFYANNTEIENAILSQNWGGAVSSSNGDYLYVNDANVGGGKSSLNIAEDINYNISHNDSGLTGNLILTRTHLGTGVWPDQANHSWTRILAPMGSTLQSAVLNGQDVTSKMETGAEAGKTYFANYIDVAPGKSSILNLTYTLPINPQDYQLLVQKQSGNSGNTMKVSFDNHVLFDGILNNDKLIK